jgi:hypothetical protein
VTELVAALYILGVATTMYGVTAAYRRAKKQRADYDAVIVRSHQLEDPTFTDFYEACKGEDETAASTLKAQVDRNQDEISNLLTSTGVTDLHQAGTTCASPLSTGAAAQRSQTHSSCSRPTDSWHSPGS